MKKLIMAAAMLVATLTACDTATTRVNTHISGRFVGSNVDSVFLERVSDNFTTPERLGAVLLADNGSFVFDLAVEPDSSPRFYRLTFSGNHRPVTLVVAPGDDITLESAGDIFLNYRVDGSEESELIREFNRAYFDAGDRLAHAVEKLLDTGDNAEDWEMEAYRAAREAIQVQLRFVGSNQDKLAAFYAMRHNVAERYIPQFIGHGITSVHRQALVEGLKKSYPDSPYIAILEREIEDDATMNDLYNNITEVSYPDIVLEDMYKKSHRLSDLKGEVVLLYFWSADDALCNNINAELRAVYEKYHDKGFEIYQVSSDAEIAYWIEAVRQQKLPWINVYGGESPNVFMMYNVALVPTAFIIDREGNMDVCSLNVESVAAEVERRL